MEQLLKRTFGDKVMWGIVILLCIFSVVVIYSSTSSLAYKHRHGHVEYFLFKQIGVLSLGIFFMWLAHRVKYTVYAQFAVVLFVISIPLLFYTLFKGQTLNGGSRWLAIPGTGFTFQTSDLAKLALFMFLARQLSRYQGQITDLKVVAKQIFLPVAIVVALIAPANLSTALMLGATCCMIFYIGRVRVKHIMYLIGAGIFGLLMIYGISKVTGKGRAETWENRVKNFMGDGHTVDKDAQFQSMQAKMAIARGGFFGVGPGNSRQRNFMPHPYSDMVFAIIIEEYGIFGAAILIGLYLYFLWRSIELFRKCPYAFGAFLALGLSFTLVFQAMLNMAVAVGLTPVTGLTLPLISMGGSSVWFTSIAIGVILSVSKYVEEVEGKKQVATT